MDTAGLAAARSGYVGYSGAGNTHEASGYGVTFCRSVTDIDDKVIQVAEREGVPWWGVAERNLRAFTHAYEALGCVPPEVEPRATGHVPEMIAMIRRLIEREHAYPAE